MKKSWREYINTVEEKIHDITPEWEDKMGKGKILIPKPLGIERIINSTKKGELLTTDIIREQLAKEKKVKLTASAPTKIYLKHIALASEEEIVKGNNNITPYWRVLLPKGLINEKFPGGYEKQQRLLESEGHKIEFYGKRKKIPKVAFYQESLITF